MIGRMLLSESASPISASVGAKGAGMRRKSGRCRRGCKPYRLPLSVSRRRVVGDNGTVLLLFPASVMVVLVLAAIVLDIGLVHVRIQELRAVAASAANDALGAVDADVLRNTGDIAFDGAVARSLVDAAVAGGPLPDAAVDSVDMTRDSQGRWEIAVTLRMSIRLTIAPALPGRMRNLTSAVTGRALVVS